MPAFLKNPKFIATSIVILWLLYILYENFQLPPVSIKLIPLMATLDFKVSAVIIGSAILGSGLTFLGQHYWRRWRSSTPASDSTASLKSRTVA